MTSCRCRHDVLTESLPTHLGRSVAAVSAWFCRLPADDSDSDDEPLIRLTMKPPSEEKLKETVQRLLEEADLKEMTMKQICQKVRRRTPPLWLLLHQV